jgi:mono/diheme cytochrome c family protein
MILRGIALAVVVVALVLATVAFAAENPAPGNQTIGRSLFLRAGIFCGSCHTLKDAKSTGRDGPNLDIARLSYAKIVDSITKGGMASKRWPTGMPRYGGRNGVLGAALIRDIAAFVYTSTHS